jgi:hypothetical protein
MNDKIHSHHVKHCVIHWSLIEQVLQLLRYHLADQINRYWLDPGQSQIQH